MRSGPWRWATSPVAAAAFVLALAVPHVPALAHHGWSQYGGDEFTLTGVIEEVYLGNPHGELKVSVDGQVWNVVLGPPSRNQRAGIEDGVIAVGDTVTAVGNRHRDGGTLEIKARLIEKNGAGYQIY